MHACRATTACMYTCDIGTNMYEWRGFVASTTERGVFSTLRKKESPD